MERKQTMLANMYTFSVAARLLSFTKAADELCITQGAVSHRIKSLEEQLGFALFVRMTRRLELTAEGERLQHALTASFDLIFTELEDIRFNELRGELYLGVAPTFAQCWLLPRLPSFQQRYPHLNVKLRVKASRLDFQHEPVDLAIYYSDAIHSDFYSKRLFDEQLVPVCSPDYWQQLQLSGDNAAQQLQGATFIHCSESLEADAPNSEWQRWLAGQDNPELKGLDVSERVYIFNHSEMAMTAAKNGMGIAVGRLSLISQALESGDLTAPFAPVSASRGYDLICPKGLQNRPRYQAFAQWLDEQIRMQGEAGLVAGS